MCPPRLKELLKDEECETISLSVPVWRNLVFHCLLPSSRPGNSSNPGLMGNLWQWFWPVVGEWGREPPPISMKTRKQRFTSGNNTRNWRPSILGETSRKNLGEFFLSETPFESFSKFVKTTTRTPFCRWFMHFTNWRNFPIPTAFLTESLFGPPI